MDTKSLHILKRNCSFQFQVCFSMCDLLIAYFHENLHFRNLAGSWIRLFKTSRLPKLVFLYLEIIYYSSGTNVLSIPLNNTFEIAAFDSFIQKNFLISVWVGTWYLMLVPHMMGELSRYLKNGYYNLAAGWKLTVKAYMLPNHGECSMTQMQELFGKIQICFTPTNKYLSKVNNRSPRLMSCSK